MDFEGECKAIAHVEGGAATICCWLPKDHDGAHWDKHDGIWWSTDAPEDRDAPTSFVAGEQVTPGTTEGN